MNIYVLGDVSSFVAALNSLVMILGVQSFIGGAALVGALVGLLAFLIFLTNKDAGGQIIPGGSPIVGLLVFFVFFSTIGIKTKVTITDVYTGNTNIVDNVPALVSMPASAISTAAYRVFDLSNTAFQGTNGSYMALGSTGFVAPLQILSTLRNGVEGLDPLFAASTKQFIIDCIPGGAVNPETMATSKDVMTYVLSTARDNGMTTTFTTAAPAGTATSCFQQKTDLAAREAVFLNAADPNYGGQSKLVAMVNQSTKQKNPSGNAVTRSDIDAAVNNVILSGLPSVAQNADQFMMNSLMYNTLNNTFNCLDQAGSQAGMSSCDIQMTQANEQWKTDASASGSLFAKTMMPAMVFMQLMFYSLAPIVIVFGLLRGAGAIRMYVSYLGFGVWTSSWMPVAAVIQMYIQNNVQGKLAQINAGGLTMGNFKAINYDVISTNLSLASDMLASTPLVTATILGVSGMAFAQLANNMGGKDRVDEKISSPDIMKNSALVQGSGMAEVNANTGVATQTGAAAPKMSFQTSNTQAMASAETTRSTEQDAIAAELSKSLNASEQRMLSSIHNNATTTSVNGSVGWRTSDGQNIQFGDGASASTVEQAAAKASVNAQAGMQLGASVNAALIPEVMKAMAKGGSKVSEADAAKLIQQSASSAMAKDANFFQKLAAGDEGAIGMLVEGVADAASVAAEVGSFGIGTGAVVAGQAAFRAGGKSAIVSGIKKAVHALGGASDRVKGVSAAIFDQTDAGAKATLSAALSSQQELANTKKDQIDQMAKSMTDWSRQDFRSGDTTNSNQHGHTNADASQRSTAAQIGEAFKHAQQRTATNDESFQRSAQQATAGGTKMEMSAPEFVQYMRKNPEQAAALQARIDQMEPQIAGAAAKARALIDNSVIAGATDREKNLAAGAMALAGVDGGFNMLAGSDPSGGMRAGSNAGLAKPDVGARVAAAEANVPHPGQIHAPQVAATPPASGKAYNQAPIGGMVAPASNPTSATAPATRPAQASQGQRAVDTDRSAELAPAGAQQAAQPAQATPGNVPDAAHQAASPAHAPRAGGVAHRADHAAATPAQARSDRAAQPAQAAQAPSNGQAAQRENAGAPVHGQQQAAHSTSPSGSKADHNDHKPAGQVSHQPGQARDAAPAPAQAPHGLAAAPLIAPGGVTPEERPTVAGLMARHNATSPSVGELQGAIKSGTVSKQELAAPDATKLSVVDQVKQVESTTFGKVTTGAVVVATGVNMASNLIAGERVENGKVVPAKNGKQAVGGSGEEAPGSAPGAAGSHSPGAKPKSDGPVLTGGNGRTPRPQRRSRR